MNLKVAVGQTPFHPPRLQRFFFLPPPPKTSKLCNYLAVRCLTLPFRGHFKFYRQSYTTKTETSAKTKSCNDSQTTGGWGQTLEAPYSAILVT